MTTHQLAAKLLAGPDVEAFVEFRGKGAPEKAWKLPVGRISCYTTQKAGEDASLEDRVNGLGEEVMILGEGR